MLSFSPTVVSLSSLPFPPSFLLSLPCLTFSSFIFLEACKGAGKERAKGRELYGCYRNTKDPCHSSQCWGSGWRHDQVSVGSSKQRSWCDGSMPMVSLATSSITCHHLPELPIFKLFVNLTFYIPTRASWCCVLLTSSLSCSIWLFYSRQFGPRGYKFNVPGSNTLPWAWHLEWRVEGVRTGFVL